MATEVKQRNNRVFVILGVALAAGAFALSLYLSQRNSTGGGGSSAPTIAAVYAQQPIPKGTKIVDGMVTVKQVPADSVPAGSPADPSAVLNKFTTTDIAQNQPVFTSNLVADQATAQTAALTVQPLDIHDGNVAMAIPVQGQGPQYTADLVSVGYFIHDDDHIDILIDPGNGSVRYSFQDVRVLHAGTYGTAANANPTVLIVEVPRAQAEELTFLMANKGTAAAVKYVLRPRDQYGKDKNGQPCTMCNPLDTGDPDPYSAVGKGQPKDVPVSQDQFNKYFPAK